MKRLTISLLILLLVSSAEGKETNYTASTPANAVVKSFLGIPLADSIDFIRWKITMNDKYYILHCNYGTSKPNTNGFINGGKKIELTGILEKEGNYYKLKNGTKVLRVLKLNNDLLHFADDNNNLLIGNGGWSYALNNIAPGLTDVISITPKETILKDSMVFEGRTPCGVPGIIPAGMQCYKLKWYIVLYADAAKKEPASYKVFGTPWRKQGGRTGNWKIEKSSKGRVFYNLYDENGKVLISLLKADGNILLFTDEKGNLLIGNEDFSYALNKR